MRKSSEVGGGVGYDRMLSLIALVVCIGSSC